jgi:predicted PurR-regulated permease PerM
VAAGLTVLLAIIVILIPLTFFGMQIFQEAQGLYLRIASGGIPFSDVLRAKLSEFQGSSTISGNVSGWDAAVNQYATQALGTIANNVGLLLTEFWGFIWTFLLAFFAFYYLLIDGEYAMKSLVKAVPLSHERAEEVLERLWKMADSVIRGSLLMALAYGILVGLEFLVFGVPNPVLWGAIGIIASFVPLIGVALVVIPAILFVGFSGHVILAIIFAIIAFLASVVMENIFRPRLMRRGTNVHPMLLLFSILGGLSFFGPIGILLGPIALSLLLALIDIYPVVSNELVKN